MKQAEAEEAIRRLVHDWARERGVKRGDINASFSDFKSWLQMNRLSACLDFRARVGADSLAEDWFDEEMGISWTN